MLSTFTRLALAGCCWLALERASEAQPFANLNPQELFGSLDANNDMVIDAGEIPAEARAAFSKLVKLADQNGNGKVEAEEYRDLLLRARDSASSAPQGFGNRFRQMDKDGDGRVSRAEFLGPQPLFDRLDANGDGFITREEGMRAQAAAAKPVVPFRPALREMDNNGDGKVSRDEFRGPPQLFDRLDANKNGAIEPGEFRPQETPAPKDAEKTPAAKPDAPG